MNEETHPPRRTWRRKFADSFRGLHLGIRGQSSFLVHLLSAAAVLLAGLALSVTAGGARSLSAGEWCLIVLSITVVLAAEMLNTALETLAAALHPEHHPEIGEALDIASGAVLIASLGASALGLIVFLPRLWALF